MKFNTKPISLSLLLAAALVGNTILPMGNNDNAVEERAQEELTVLLVPANQIAALEGQEGVEAILPLDEEDAQLLANESNPEKVKNCLLRVIDKAKNLTPNQKGTALVAGLAIVSAAGSFVADHVLRVYPAISFISYSMFGAALKGAIKDMNSKNKTKLAIGMLIGGVVIDYAILPFVGIADHTAAALGLFTAATSMKKLVKATHKMFKEEKKDKALIAQNENDKNV